jgi:hypothetical protein
LAKAFLYLAENDEERERLGKMGRERVLSIFTEEKQVGKLVQLIEEARSRKPGDRSQKPEFRSQKPGRKPEARSQKPGQEARIQKPGQEARIQKPGQEARIQKPGQEARIQKPEPRSQKPGAGSQGTGGRESK